MRVFGRLAFGCCQYFLICFLITVSIISLGQPSRAQDPQPAADCSSDPEASKRFALLVGINEYAESFEGPQFTPRKLQGPENDLIKIRQLLVDTYCFLDDGEHIVALTSDQATEDAIATQFRTHLVGNAEQNQNGTFLFYFAGHGSQAGDLDEDEGDRWDETILAYDSRTIGKRGITDDEIALLLGELTRAASGPNASVTLIFDSCYSGSITRAETSLIARMVEPTPTERAIAEQQPAARGAELSGFLPSGDDFTVLSASRPEEVAYEDEIEALNDDQRYGLFSYYLTEVLRRSPGITFKEAEQEVTQLIQKHATQHAVAEGDVDRPIFGAAGDRQEPFIAIRSIAQDRNTFTIEAGLIHGIQNGAILAIYDPTSTTLSGEDRKLATASVTRADDRTSVATFIEHPDTQLPGGAKVKIVSPYSAETRLPVYLGTPPIAADTAFDRAVRQQLTDMVSKSPLARLRTDDEAAADTDELRLTAGCYAIDLQRLPLEAPDEQVLRQPLELFVLGDEPCSRAYYLTAPGSAEPLFDFFTISTDATIVAEQIMEAINKRAKQLNLERLLNLVPGETLKGNVSLTLVKLRLDIQDGMITEVLSREPVNEGEIATLQMGDYFNFRIANNSSDDIYYALLQIGTDGSITLLSENRGGNRLQSGLTAFTKIPLMAGPPAGIDTYKIIASTNPNLRFDVLEQPAITNRNVNLPSALEILLANSVNESTRTGGMAGQEMRLDDWTTTQIEVRVMERQE